MFSIISVQLLSCVRLFATPWTAARQASLSIINSRSLLKLMSIESMMPSNHLILCHPLLSPSIFPSIRVFSNELAPRIRWPKYWSFSFSISPSNEHSGLTSFRMNRQQNLLRSSRTGVHSPQAMEPEPGLTVGGEWEGVSEAKFKMLCFAHSPAAPHPPAPIRGKIVVHETSPWGQKVGNR